MYSISLIPFHGQILCQFQWCGIVSCSFSYLIRCLLPLYCIIIEYIYCVNRMGKATIKWEKAIIVSASIEWKDMYTTIQCRNTILSKWDVLASFPKYLYSFSTRSFARELLVGGYSIGFWLDFFYKKKLQNTGRKAFIFFTSHLYRVIRVACNANLFYRDLFGALAIVRRNSLHCSIVLTCTIQLSVVCIVCEVVRYFL